VTCALFSSLKTNLLQHFTVQAGDHPGEHFNSPVWIEQLLGHGVV